MVFFPLLKKANKERKKGFGLEEKKKKKDIGQTSNLDIPIQKPSLCPQ